MEFSRETAAVQGFIRRVAVAGLLMGLVLTGCASLEKDRRAMGLEAATNAYQSALRWGDFDAAMGLLAPELRGAEALPQVLTDLRITRYEVVQPPVIRADDGATQTVNIEYLFEYDQILRRLTDRQVWRWDEQDKAWWLQSGLPAF
ncbi:MAG: hypothetical protein LC667_13245 [Thioalkalivibrio sp.]|nr:hypothetical protein [Thioalkalivibrio sp.]